MKALDYQLLSAVIENDIAAVRASVEAGASCTVRELLHYAAREGFMEIMSFLLETDARANIDAFDELSLTPLAWACKSNNILVARLLVAAGANVNVRESIKAGNTALHEAVRSASPEIVSFLLEHGASPEIPGWMNATAVDMAQYRMERCSDKSAQKIFQLLKRNIDCRTKTC